MMVGKGQPPKAPEDKRKNFPVGLSPKERETLETARDTEAPEKGLGSYVRDVALDHAENIVKKKRKK